MKTGTLPLISLVLFIPCLPACQQSQQIVAKEMEISLSREMVMLSETVNQGSPRWFEILDSAILLNPKNAAAYREKSVWFTKTGDYVNAYSLLNKAVELDPLDALGYRGWLKLYKLHDFEGAIKDFEALDKLTPTTTDYPWGENLYFLLGQAKRQLGKREEALIDYDKYIQEVSIKQGERWVELYTFIDKGICLRELNKYDSAIVSFYKALKYYKECPEAYFQIAITLKSLNKSTEACDFLTQALIYARQGRLRVDPYKDYFNQLYVEEIEENLLDCKK